MKKTKRMLLTILFAAALFFGSGFESHSKIAKLEPVIGDPFIEPVKIRVTCYCEHSKTATGVQTRDGIIAGKKEWLGYTAELNAINPDGTIGEFVGFYEFKDTGAGMDTDGDGKGDSIKCGQSVDVWVNSLSDAYKWRDKYGDYMFIKIIKGDG